MANHRHLLDTDGQPFQIASRDDHNDKCPEVLVALTEIEVLKDWQKRQNGSLQRMEESMDKFNDRLESIYKTNLALTGTIIIALIGGIIALLQLT